MTDFVLRGQAEKVCRLLCACEAIKERIIMRVIDGLDWSSCRIPSMLTRHARTGAVGRALHSIDDFIDLVFLEIFCMCKNNDLSDQSNGNNLYTKDNQ